MKGFIKRLTLFVHWIAFETLIYGVLGFLFRIVGNVSLNGGMRIRL